jgi:hypothetical protein
MAWSDSFHLGGTMPRSQSPTRLASRAGVLAVIVVAIAGTSRAAAMPTAPGADRQVTAQRVNPNAKAIAEFQEEVGKYLELHRKLDRTLPVDPAGAQE